MSAPSTSATTTAASGASDHARAVDLDLGGMTCASCAGRIERKLNKLDGVSAVVNLATESARVELAGTADVDDLVHAVEAAGYTATPRAEVEVSRPGDEGDGLRRRVLVAAVLALPVVVLSMVPPLQFDYWQWLAFALTTPVVAYCAWPFHRAAAVPLRHGATTMDTLVSLGVLASYLWSVYAITLGGAGGPGLRHAFTVPWAAGAHGRDMTGVSMAGVDMAEVYFEAAAAVTALVLLGRYIEHRSRREAGAALRALLELGADEVRVLRADGDGRRVEQTVPIGALRVGDEFVARPGESLAADGVVVSGRSAIDASLLTGESVPVDVGPGDEVTGATIVSGGRLVVRATRVGGETQLARMARMVADAQAGKARIQRLVDRISAVFVPVVLALSVVTFTAWAVFGGSVDAAFTAAVSVLVIACPCALGLATPMALMVGSGAGARRGILVGGPDALEAARGIDTVVLDKTGTLTTGRMRLDRVWTVDGDAGARGVGISGGADAGGADAGGDDASGDDADACTDAAPDRLLSVVAAVESGSEHPVARAIARATEEQGLEVPEATDFVSTAGRGVAGLVGGLRVEAASLAALGAELPDHVAAPARSAELAGATVVAVTVDDRVAGALAVADTVRPTSAAAVADLHRQGLRTVLLTGDAAGPAHRVAEAVGIVEVIAGVRPEGKLEVVDRLRAEGRRVAMVGDGVNDAPALARADLGIAMGTGSHVAIEAGDLTIVAGDPRAVGEAIALARRTVSTIRGNLFWAFAYNVAALPLAAFGLLTPVIAGAAMAFSSVFVVLNSLRLRTA